MRTKSCGARVCQVCQIAGSTHGEGEGDAAYGITISPHKCLNSGMLSHTFLRSTHSGVLIRTDLGLKPSALPHLKGSPIISSAASHTHTIGIPIRRGSEVSLTTNFPFTPECGLSVSHRLDIMRSLHDLTRCNNAVVATLIRIYVSGEVEPKYFSV